MSDADMPAFPIDSEKVLAEGPFAGLSKRQIAAIELRVPSSGTEWLDDMIRESRRWDAAQAALTGFVSLAHTVDDYGSKSIAHDAALQADALLKSMGERS